MRALATWSGALAGLLLILLGGLLPAAIVVPLPPHLISLPATWQVPRAPVVRAGLWPQGRRDRLCGLPQPWSDGPAGLP